MLEFLSAFLAAPLLFAATLGVVGISVIMFIKYAHPFGRNINDYIAQHGYTYIREARSMDFKGILEGSLVTQHVSGSLPISQNAFDLFVAHKETHSQTIGLEDIAISTIRVKIPNTTAHHVLDSQKNNSIISNVIPESYSSLRTPQLEGEFGEYYHVISIKKEKTARQILLTDSAMSYAIEHLTQCDIELIDDELLFYFPSHISVAHYDEMLEKIDGYIQELHLQQPAHRDIKTAKPISANENKKAPTALTRTHSLTHTIVNIAICATGLILVGLILLSPVLDSALIATIAPYIFIGIIALLGISLLLALLKPSHRPR